MQSKPPNDGPAVAATPLPPHTGGTADKPAPDLGDLDCPSGSGLPVLHADDPDNPSRSGLRAADSAEILLSGGPTPLVLASGSSARRRLMTSAGYRFRVVSPVDREAALSARRLGPVDFVSAQAYLKARDVADRLSGGSAVVVGADTVTLVDGRVLGKPGDPAEARAMLRAIAGREHEVVTGLTLIDLSAHRRVISHARTVLRMRPMSETDIDALILGERAGFSLQAAGGYALIEGGDPNIEIVEGSESNVVGLPMELLARLLKAIGRSAMIPAAAKAALSAAKPSQS
jgi:septum formation protein